MFTPKDYEAIRHILTWTDEEIADLFGDDIIKEIKEKLIIVKRKLQRKQTAVYSNQK